MSTKKEKIEGLSAEEIAAMKETLKERKAAASKEEAENAVLEKIAEMKGSDHGHVCNLHYGRRQFFCNHSGSDYTGQPVDSL